MNKRERALAWLVLAITAILFTASMWSDGSAVVDLNNGEPVSGPILTFVVSDEEQVKARNP